MFPPCFDFYLIYLLNCFGLKNQLFFFSGHPPTAAWQAFVRTHPEYAAAAPAVALPAPLALHPSPAAPPRPPLSLPPPGLPSGDNNGGSPALAVLQSVGAGTTREVGSIAPVGKIPAIRASPSPTMAEALAAWQVLQQQQHAGQRLGY